VQVGFGKFSPGDIKTMLAKTDRTAAGMSAPAHGLVLWKVFYQPQRRRAHREKSFKS
jgi:tRNA pseudouridine38-40 synthase